MQYFVIGSSSCDWPKKIKDNLFFEFKQSNWQFYKSFYLFLHEFQLPIFMQILFHPKPNTKEEPYPVFKCQIEPPNWRAQIELYCYSTRARFSTVRLSSLHIIRYNTISMKEYDTFAEQSIRGLIGSNCKFRFTTKTSSIFQGLESIRICIPKHDPFISPVSSLFSIILKNDVPLCC